MGLLMCFLLVISILNENDVCAIIVLRPSGIVPMLCVLNEISRYVDQGRDNINGRFLCFFILLYGLFCFNYFLKFFDLNIIKNLIRYFLY
jgi:small neutral amino acid transporter SnatA (MarC family)